MNDAIAACDSAIENGDATVVPDTILNINPDFRDPQYMKLGLTNGDSTKQVLCSLFRFTFNSLLCVFSVCLEWFQ